MRYCKNCGTLCKGSFCPKCGTPIQTREAEPDKTGSGVNLKKSGADTAGETGSSVNLKKAGAAASGETGGVNLQKTGTAAADGGVNLQKMGTAAAAGAADGGVNLQKTDAAAAAGTAGGGVNLQKTDAAAAAAGAAADGGVNLQKTDTAAAAGTAGGGVNLQKTGTAAADAAAGGANLQETGAAYTGNQPDDRSWQGAGNYTAGNYTAGNSAGAGNDLNTASDYSQSRMQSLLRRRWKIFLDAAACTVVIISVLAGWHAVKNEDSSTADWQEEALQEDALRQADAVRQEEERLEEQRRQEEAALQEEQRRQEEAALQEEQRRQEEAALQEEQRRREEEAAKVYVSEYEVVISDATWKEAKRQAEARGGHLAVITSEEEQKEIEELVDQYDFLHTIWLGGKYKNGEFQWINKEDFDYTDWGPGEPNNETGDEFYLQMYESSDIWYWNDVPNDIKQYYSGKMGYVIEWEIEQQAAGESGTKGTA